MSFIQVVLLALSLCVDTIGVAISGSVGLGKVSFGRLSYMTVIFGIIHCTFLFTGWLLGAAIEQYVERVASIIGFILLLYVGGKMLIEAIKGVEEVEALTGAKTLLIAAAATSIDAAAVGVALALDGINLAGMVPYILTLFMVTLIIVSIGVLGGSAIGKKFGRPARVAGGIVLISIGFSILLS